MKKSRNTLVIGGILAATVLAVLAWKGMLGYPPQGTEGAIGAAKRYQTDQIAPSDVQISDAQMQSLLQSDLFRRMQTDSEFRKAVIDGGLERFVTAQARALEIARAATELGHAVESAKSTDAARASEAASRAEEVANKAEALAAIKDYERLVDAEHSVIELAKATEELSRFLEVEHLVDEAKLTELDRAVEALSHFSDAARGYITGSRATEVANAARELEKAAEAAHNVTLENKAVEVARLAEVLSASRESGKAPVDLEKASVELAKAATELSRMEEVGKLTEAGMTIIELAKSAEALNRLTETGMTFDAGNKFLELARLVDSGKFTTEPN